MKGLRFAAGAILLCVFFQALALAQRYTFTEPIAGLDNLNVDCAAQDSAGYLWVGTENGLYQFDGLRFAKIGPSRGLNARTIQDILATPDGELLVGTTEGVFFRTPDGQFTEILPPDLSLFSAHRLGLYAYGSRSVCGNGSPRSLRVAEDRAVCLDQPESASGE